MSEHDATRFRKQADECREQAAKAVSPLDKSRGFESLRNGSSWHRQSMTGDGRAAIRNSGSYPDSSRRGHAQSAREIDHVA